MPAELPSLHAIYRLLRKQFGHRDWWPGETPLEVIVGAILTQNTAWKNVEKAIGKLKEEKLLSIPRLREIDEQILAGCLRSSGYYNQKAKKIKAFIAFLDENYHGSLSQMKKAPLERLRHELLQVHGIGPETADSILLYALEKPIFVIDAYTRRIFTRHFYFSSEPSYAQAQDFFQAHCPEDIALYNDYHAQIVACGNRYCKPTPRCEGCPLEHLPHRAETKETKTGEKP